MSLDQKNVELFERIIYKNGDDLAVSIARSFERLEERIDAAEARIYSRIADVEDRIDTLATTVGEIADNLKSLRSCMSE